MPPPSPVRRREFAPTRSSAPTMIVMVVALLAVSLGCSRAASTPPAAPPPGTAGPQVASPPTTPAPPEPDKLPDPGVGPGDCKVINYTPATAKESFPGELC